MYFIITYLTGFALAIILGVVDMHTEGEKVGIAANVILWIGSPFIVPVVAVIGILCVIGFVMNYLVKQLEKALYQEGR